MFSFACFLHISVSGIGFFGFCEDFQCGLRKDRLLGVWKVLQQFLSVKVSTCPRLRADSPRSFEDSIG